MCVTRELKPKLMSMISRDKLPRNWERNLTITIAILKAVVSKQWDKAVEIVRSRYEANSAIELFNAGTPIRSLNTRLESSQRSRKSRLPLRVTPLQLTSAMGCLPVVAALLEKGENVEEVDHDKQTALHLAALNGRHDVCVLLLSHGASLEARTHFADTPLHLAARRGHFHCTVALVLAGAPLQLLNSAGQRPLEEGSEHSHVHQYLRNAMQKEIGGLSGEAQVTRADTQTAQAAGRSPERGGLKRTISSSTSSLHPHSFSSQPSLEDSREHHSTPPGNGSDSSWPPAGQTSTDWYPHTWHTWSEAPPSYYDATHQPSDNTDSLYVNAHTPLTARSSYSSS